MERDQMMRHIIFGGAIAAAASAMVVAGVLDDKSSTSFHSRTIEMSGIEEARTINLRDFDRIRVRGGYEVDLTGGKDFDVEIEGDTALLDSLQSRVENGELIIEPESARYQLRDFEGVELRVSMPTLRAFTVDGAAEADLRALESEELILTINGAGDIEAKGTCAALIATTNGAGEIKARGLQCDHATLTINGAGQMTAYARDSAMVTVNGVGEIDVYGNPQEVHKNRSGIGEIRVHGTNGDTE